MTGQKAITVLGATGSVGASALDLIGRAPERFRVEAVTANANGAALARLARAHGAAFAAVADASAYRDLKEGVSGSTIEVAAGPAAVAEAAGRKADLVVAAITGFAGLRPTLAAIESGNPIALANKETLVAAGPLVMRRAAERGVMILPVDSEHNAVFQSLAGSRRADVEKVTLTASGGPFRLWSAERIAQARPQDALAHPNWSMGAKITVDSASLMNKGLELIEAMHLFTLSPDELDVVVHPQSTIHALVAFRDGSTLAQLGAPDMRVPIAHCLAYPERITTPVKRLDLAALGRLDFEAPDLARFPCLKLAMEAMRVGSRAQATLNAANEVAVAAFLSGRVGFPAIAAIVEETLAALASGPEPASVDEVEFIDHVARERAAALLGSAA